MITPNITHNFHITVDECVDDINDSSDGRIKHYCFLFTGKLNYFGTPLWEEHVLKHYKTVAKTAANNNIKVTFKFIAYDEDEIFSGNNCIRLSGYGNIYKYLFTNIKNFNDITDCKYENKHYPEITKYDDINSWLENTALPSSKLKKHDFERYCKTTFDFADSLEFYYVNSEYTLEKMKSVFKNSDIKSTYGWGQHFQVNNAYENYPNMFDDCHDETLIIKVRYDGVYFSYPFITMQSLKNAFYSANHNTNFKSFLPAKITNYDFYVLPTVMYTRMFPYEITRISHFPNDISLVFNTPGIKKYAADCTDWLLQLSASMYGNDIQGVIGLGLNIHTSLGKFYLDNGFNTIDYSPFAEKRLRQLDMFGYIFRYFEMPDTTMLTDIYDDYKIRWYDKQEDIRQMIIDKFGKHDNT